MTNRMSDNPGLILSNAVAGAVDRAGQVTALVNARRRLPLSGILVEGGLVLTANHGVERETDIQVILPDGAELGASLAGRDEGMDLAVLRLAGATALAPAVPSAVEPRAGHLVVAVGRPSSDGVQASFGMLTAIGGGLRTPGGAFLDRYLVTSAVPYPGFSGGPLADLAGDVLGINTSGLVRGMSLAIPAREAFEAARNLAQHGHIKRGYLGIRSQAVEIPEQALSALQGGQREGLLVVGVEPEGPAAGSLMVGDILVGLNGQPVTDHDALVSRLAGDVVGRPAEIQVLRGGQLQTVRVTVGERK